MPMLSLALLITLNAARASVVLDYQVADACPNEGEFRARVWGRLGFDTFAESGPKVLVRLFGHDGAWQGSLKVGADTRTFTAAGCSKIATEVAQALALILDPELLTREDDLMSQQPANEAPEQAVEEPAPLPALPPTVPAAGKLHLGISVGPRFTAGLSPSVTGGIAADAQLLHDRFSIELGIDAAFAPPYAVDAYSFKTTVLRGRLSGCARWGPVSLCASTAAGVAEVESSDIPGSNQISLALWSVGPLVHADFNVWSDLWLGASAALDVALFHPYVGFGQSAVWSTAPLSCDLGLNVAWRFL